MKSLYSVLGIVSALALLGMVITIGSHHVYAPRDCAGCAEFKKLTSQFEKDVLKASLGSPEEIPGLLEQYTNDVLDLFPSSSR